MTRPTDAAIARAFFEIAHPHGYVREAVLKRAAEFDAESPAGMSKSAPEVTTSPERVQIPAESKHVCSRPTCRAEMRPGLRCSSPHCGLKE